MADTPLLAARDLTYRPPHAESSVLDGAAFLLDRGEIVDVAGPSGSGKTTLLRALARLLPGMAGTLTLSGSDADEIPPREWRLRVALLPQVAAMRAGSVRDNLLLPWTLKVRTHQSPPTEAALQQALAGVGLDSIALDRDASRLSVGQAARISLLRVTLTGPDILLLDEPDANLDDESAEQVTALAETFAAEEGAVVRVRHLRRDEGATRHVRVADGRVEEVAQ